jgi:hypothetical protein
MKAVTRSTDNRAEHLTIVLQYLILFLVHLDDILVSLVCPYMKRFESQSEL